MLLFLCTQTSRGQRKTSLWANFALRSLISSILYNTLYPSSPRFFLIPCHQTQTLKIDSLLFLVLPWTGTIKVSPLSFCWMWNISALYLRLSVYFLVPHSVQFSPGVQLEVLRISFQRRFLAILVFSTYFLVHPLFPSYCFIIKSYPSSDPSRYHSNFGAPFPD